MSQSRLHARQLQPSLNASKTNPVAKSSTPRTVGPIEPKPRMDKAIINRSLVFVHDYTHYIRIDISCKQLATEDPHFLLKSLFNNMNNLAANVSVTTKTKTVLWPSLFVVSQFDALISKEAEQDRGCYLIALDGPLDEEISEKARQCIADEEKEIRTRNIDFKDYDPLPALSTHTVTKQQLGLLQMDQWIYPSIPTTQAPLFFTPDSFPDGHDATDLLTTTESITPPTPEGHVPVGETLKPVQEQINRIRWDKSLDVTDYAIVYEDRFDGLMERDVDVLTGESTDESFIPQSRIKSIKRKSTGQVVWHRNERLDLLSLE